MFLTTHHVRTLQSFADIDAAVGFGAPADATAAGVPDGPRIPTRTAFGLSAAQTAPPSSPGFAGHLLMSREASEAVGLPPGRGSVRLLDGPEYLVAGELRVPEFLSAWEPLAVVPSDGDQMPMPVDTIAVLVRDPGSVAAVTNAVSALLADLSPDGYSLETSADLAQLRAAVRGELSSSGRALAVLLMASATALTLIVTSGLVLLRRRDFGRRRALGATRLTLSMLVLVQVAMTALPAATAGACLSVAWLASQAGVLPSGQFLVAVCLGLGACATAGAGLPAAMAALREPVAELRMP